MNWRSLESEEDLQRIIKDSHQQPLAIFKHSTRCGISSMVKRRLESKWEKETSDVPLYLLDLIAHRELSDKVSATFEIRHESPQLILLINGSSTYHASHISISANALAKHIEK